MEQMQAFIEKAKSDRSLMAKLDELGAAGTAEEKIVALAAEYGYNITVEDYRAAYEAAGTPKSGVLSEEDLDDVAGGGGTQNRYDPKVCGQYTKVHYNCVGFLGGCWCDHYYAKLVDGGFLRTKAERHTCRMGYFDYKEE